MSIHDSPGPGKTEIWSAPLATVPLVERSHKYPPLLDKLGLRTVGDLLRHCPSRWEDRRQLHRIAQLVPGGDATVRAVVASARRIRIRGGRYVAQLELDDGSGRVLLQGFGQPWLTETFPPGTAVFAYIRMSGSGRGPRRLSSSSFELERILGEEDALIHTGRIVPVYPTTAGLPQTWLRALVFHLLEEVGEAVPDPLPTTVRDAHRLIPSFRAVRSIHFPDSPSDREDARRRLSFEEFFFLELVMARRRAQIAREPKMSKYEVRRTLLTPFRERLGFELTGAQRRVINEIFHDLQTPWPMNRLLQGDVGSGKTVVALSALLLAVENGHQGALMAPTEVLAEQHLVTIRDFLRGLPVRVDLLTGKVAAREKEELRARTASGETHILIGTHALLEEGVVFHDLSLVVVDEQHRFGVAQRAGIKDKGRRPDMLVMTATPIPRTLALTLYGDLDVSVLDESPPGRPPVETRRVPSRAAYALVRERVRQGQQAYLIYPLVEESDKVEWKSVVEMADRLRREVFPDLRLGVLHGQLPGEEKAEVMRAFAAGGYDALIATTVVEVGIDVPNATVMVVEDSPRFGLATLHQLRGRVGRGTTRSLCLLLGTPRTEEARRRIQILLDTTDGFRIAEEDLRLRGPGEFLGTAQHGLPEFTYGDLVRDTGLVAQAREAAGRVIQADPELAAPEHATARAHFLTRYGPRLDLAGIG